MRWVVVIAIATGLCGACQAVGPAGPAQPEVSAGPGAARSRPVRQPLSLEPAVTIDRPMGCIRGPFGCDD